MLAVLALGAVVASAAQAVEAPHFKVAGARLGTGKSKEITSKSSTIDIDIGSSITTCSVKVASGAKIFGSSIGNSGTGELELEFSECKGVAGGKCTFSGSYTTKPLKLTLAAVENAELSKGKGDQLDALLYATGSEWMKVKFNTGCYIGSEAIVVGSLAAEVYSAGKPVKIGEEPAEAKTVELVFPESVIRQVTLVEGGVAFEEGVELEASGHYFAVWGKSTLELASGENWGVFYSL